MGIWHVAATNTVAVSEGSVGLLKSIAKRTGLRVAFAGAVAERHGQRRADAAAAQHHAPERCTARALGFAEAEEEENGEQRDRGQRDGDGQLRHVHGL